ncbi:LysR family transcriptional regulator [Acidothermaceae bacterium B102]|nr:LysR family transcriptional regulator [Acidothermaceae bacterium B102]
MELRHLEHFVAVAEERSFTRAAARIHLVQSALSVSVRSLERELDARLFDRTTHHVELTDAGQALLVEARRTLHAAEAAKDAVASVRGGVRGTLRIGVMHSLGIVDLAGMLTRYRQTWPDVTIHPRTSAEGSVGLTRSVVDGGLDLAFASLTSAPLAGCVATTMASEPLLLACPPGHALGRRGSVSLEQLGGATFVDFPVGWGARSSIDQLFADAGLSRDVTMEVGDVPTVAELVRAGLGFAFMARSMVPVGLDLELRRVTPSAAFNVSLVAPANRPQTRAALAFQEIVAGRG